MRVLEVVGPLASNMMYLAPYRKVSQALDQKDLGAFDPIPTAILGFYVCGWLFFSLLFYETPNVTISLFASSIAGYCLTNYYSVRMLQIIFNLSNQVTTKAPVITEDESFFSSNSVLITLIVFGGAFWTTFYGGVILFVETTADRVSIFGNVLIPVGLWYWTSPFKILWRSFQNKSCLGVSLRISATNGLTSAIWVFYAILLDNYTIMILSGVGLTFSCAQILTVFLYRRRPQQHEPLGVEMNVSGVSLESGSHSAVLSERPKPLGIHWAGATRHRSSTL